MKCASFDVSVAHSAGGAERNWSTHGHIRSDLHHSLLPNTLARYVRTYRNMRLRDRVQARGVKACASKPKAYPLEAGDWSSCDESEEENADLATVAMGF